MVNHIPASAVPAQAVTWESIDSYLINFSKTLPQIVLPKHAYGGTGYLDGLQAEDMAEPMMGGVDWHGRNFIALKLQSTNTTKGKRIDAGVEVLFRRYTESGPWVTGGPISLLNSALGPDEFVAIKALLETGSCSQERGYPTRIMMYELLK